MEAEQFARELGRAMGTAVFIIVAIWGVIKVIGKLRAER
jgi:hypothetical protein